MTIEVNLLIVEDDAAQLSSWDAAIELHNSEAEIHGFYIKQNQAKSLEDAKKSLTDVRFDAAIVDVRLEQREGQLGPNADGNEVLNIILNSELAVTALFSGEANLAVTPDWCNVTVFAKADSGGLDSVLVWLKGQVPMIKQIKNAQADIQREMAKLFSRSIWPRWSHWIQDSQSSGGDYIEHALTRHITSHIYTVFLEKGEQKVHPEEWYFIPSIREGVRTGDIIKTDDTIEVVITPRCDLARNGNNETYQLVKCKDVSLEWNELCVAVDEAKKNLKTNTNDPSIPKLEKKIDAAEKNLRMFSQHKSNSNVYHFLPSMRVDDKNSFGPYFIQFDNIRSISRDDISTEQLLSKRFASLSPEFLPSLVERLGAFFSRIGTPDYSHPD